MKQALCEAAKLQPTAARSVKGRRLWVRGVKPDNAALRVLVIGGIHGDLSSASLVLQWIGMAEQAPADLPQPVHWRFIPALNPDGLFGQPPSRVNANGVDRTAQFDTHSAGCVKHARCGLTCCAGPANGLRLPKDPPGTAAGMR